VTEEDEKLVKGYIEKNKVTYPIVIEKGGKSSSKLGVNGIPHAFLVDPKGKIAWSGHPSGLREGELEKVLAGARKPGSPLTGALAPVGKLMDKQEFGKAYATLKAAIDAGTLQGEQKETAEGMAASILGQATSLYDEGMAHVEKQQYFLGVRKLEQVAGPYAGVHQTDAAVAKVKDLRADPAIVKQIAGGEKFEKAKALEEDKDYGKARDGYLAVAKELTGTKVAEEAQAAADRIKNKGLLGFDKKCNACVSLETACAKHRKKG
jgi:hypothetical protein